MAQSVFASHLLFNTRVYRHFFQCLIVVAEPERMVTKAVQKQLCLHCTLDLRSGFWTCTQHTRQAGKMNDEAAKNNLSWSN